MIITAAKAAPRASRCLGVRNAYVQLDRERSVRKVQPRRSDDREPFGDRAYRARGAMVQRSFGFRPATPYRAATRLSFWAMKDRGRRISESAGGPLLRGLQDAGAASGFAFPHRILASGALSFRPC